MIANNNASEISQQDPLQLFELLEEIGSGAYGSVYKALYKSTGETVAIKIVPKNQQRELIQNEITILQNCKSDYIVKYYASYLKDDSLWIVMEYCAAGSMSDLIRICDIQLKQEEIASILQAVLRGLQYLHSNRKIHRDIKAGNILLDQKGNIKLADFGISTEIATFAKKNTAIGSPYWMSPEMLLNSPYDQKTDIWSFGITAIQIAEGAAPYSHIHPMRAMFVIKSNPIKGLAEKNRWSQQFYDLVQSCLNVNSEARPTAEQLLNHPFIVKKSRGKSILAQLFINSNDMIEKHRMKEIKRKYLNQNQNSLQMKFIQENKNTIKPETNSIRSYRSENSNLEQQQQQFNTGTLVVNETLKQPASETQFMKFAKKMKEVQIVFSNKNEINQMIDNLHKKQQSEEQIRDKIKEYDDQCEKELNEVLQKHKKKITEKVLELKRLYNKSIKKDQIKTLNLQIKVICPTNNIGKFQEIKNINNINSINISIGQIPQKKQESITANKKVPSPSFDSQTSAEVPQQAFKKVKKYQQFIEDPQVLQYIRKTYFSKNK